MDSKWTWMLVGVVVGYWVVPKVTAATSRRSAS
jgi:hypothetical protein